MLEPRLIGGAESAPGLGRRADAVSDLYFHPSNVDALQLSVRYEVYMQTGAVIDRQPLPAFQAAMRRVFEDRSPGLALDAGAAVREVRSMNRELVRRLADDVSGAVRHHSWYLADISKPVPLPQSRGVAPSARAAGRVAFPHWVMSDEELRREGRGR